MEPIKVFYNGYGCELDKKADKLDEIMGYFYLYDLDTIRFHEVGHAKIKFLLDTHGRENKYIFLASENFEHTPFDIIKGQDVYIQENGNALRLIFEDDTPPVQQNNAPKEKPSLLNAPKRQDDWFEVINETVNQFYAENEVMPTATQVWNLLSTQPPTGYAITTGNDKGEICLNIAGCRLLSKSAFQERWRKYTK